MYRSYTRLAVALTAGVSIGCSALYHNSIRAEQQQPPPLPPPIPASVSSISPLFLRPPSPASITLPPSLPPRLPHLHPLLAVVIVRHGARTAVNYSAGQSPAQFEELWGRCHPIDSEAKRQRDAKKEVGRESEAQPLDVPRPEEAPADENATAPCARGQLTQTGEHQLREVGAMLRQQYVEQDQLLPPSFTSSALALRSTNTSRTRLSTVRLVQGLYPGTPLATIRALISVKPERDEDLFPPYRYCDRLRELFHSTLQQPLYRQYLDTEPLTSFHQQAVSLLANTPFDANSKQQQDVSWVAMSDDLKCRQAEHLPLPAHITDEIAAHIERSAEFMFHSLLKAGEHPTLGREHYINALLDDRTSRVNENARLSVGRFIQSLLPPFEAVVRGGGSVPDGAARLHVYGAHDSSFVSIMSALGMDEPLQGNWPPFASYMVVELLSEDGSDERFVRVVFNGRQAALMHYGEWVRRVQRVRVDDWQAECKAHSTTPVPPQIW